MQNYFEITVKNVVAVKIVHSIEGLNKDSESFGLGKGVIVGLVAKQVTFVSILHDQINPVLLLQNIPQPHHMWVIQRIMNTNLPL